MVQCTEWHSPRTFSSGAIAVQVADVDRHRVGVVEDPGVRAQPTHVGGEVGEKPAVRRPRKMPPTPRVSPMVCRNPWRSGISRSARVASRPPTIVTTKSHPRAQPRGRGGLTTASAPARPAAWATPTATSAAPRRCRADARSSPLVVPRGQVGEEVLRELHAARAQERDHRARAHVFNQPAGCALGASNAQRLRTLRALLAFAHERGRPVRARGSLPCSRHALGCNIGRPGKPR